MQTTFTVQRPRCLCKVSSESKQLLFFGPHFFLFVSFSPLEPLECMLHKKTGINHIKYATSGINPWWKNARQYFITLLYAKPSSVFHPWCPWNYRTVWAFNTWIHGDERTSPVRFGLRCCRQNREKLLSIGWYHPTDDPNVRVRGLVMRDVYELGTETCNHLSILVCSSTPLRSGNTSIIQRNRLDELC